MIYVTRPEEDQEHPPSAERLGWAAGVVWIESESDPGEPWRAPTAQEFDAAKRELPALRTLKQAVNRRIEREVGDLHEVVADQARQIESLTMLVTRLVSEIWGEHDVPGPIKAAYTARAQAVLDAVDAGDLHLRGDYEDPEAMIQRIQQRASRINEIVGEYLPKRDAILGGADHGD